MSMKATGMDFTQMVEAELPALRRHARTVTRDSDIADDIVQDTLVRALRFPHLFQGDNVRGWLHTILINLNRNRLRSLARRPSFSSINENDASDFAGPEAGGRVNVRFGSLADTCIAITMTSAWSWHTRAEPMRPISTGVIAMSCLRRGMAIPSATTEKPSSKVPPLASSQ